MSPPQIVILGLSERERTLILIMTCQPARPGSSSLQCLLPTRGKAETDLCVPVILNICHPRFSFRFINNINFPHSLIPHYHRIFGNTHIGLLRIHTNFSVVGFVVNKIMKVSHSATDDLMELENTVIDNHAPHCCTRITRMGCDWYSTKTVFVQQKRTIIVAYTIIFGTGEGATVGR